MFSNAGLPQNNAVLPESHKLSYPAHVFTQLYTKCEHNEGIIPAAIESGRLIDVPITL
jgi:hypothetical protein